METFGESRDASLSLWPIGTRSQKKLFKAYIARFLTLKIV